LGPGQYSTKSNNKNIRPVETGRYILHFRPENLPDGSQESGRYILHFRPVETGRYR